MNLFDSLSVSASALSAERQRSEIIAANLANAETTHTTSGGPYKRKEVVFQSQGSPTFGFTLANATLGSQPSGEVRISEVVDDPAPPVMRYEPGHPDANKEGYVAYPAIDPTMELVDMMGAVRAYQLNASAVNATKQMIQQSLEVLKS